MKNTILLFAFIFLSTCGFSQVKQHKSTEKEKYYEKLRENLKEPKPINKQDIYYYDDFWYSENNSDSDSDGLSDADENIFFTDPNNPDTDGDGLPDGIDTNPRFTAPRTDKTRVVEVILDEIIEFYDTIYISINDKPSFCKASEDTKTYLIVSDDPAVWSAQPDSKRIIVLTEQEFEQYGNSHRIQPRRIWFSPFFRVDNEENAFLFHYGDLTLTNHYYMKKEIDKWKIALEFSIIE